MGRGNTGADALIEILELCEQALTAVCLSEDATTQQQPVDKSSQSRPQKRTNLARRLILVQGGRAANIRHPNAR
jgi:hypothetical protein